MIEDERDPLGRRQFLQSFLQHLTPISLTKLALEVLRRGKFNFGRLFLIVAAAQIAKEGPTRPIPAEMIQTHIGRDGLEPASGSRALAKVCEAFVGLEKDLLRNILR